MSDSLKRSKKKKSSRSSKSSGSGSGSSSRRGAAAAAAADPDDDKHGKRVAAGGRGRAVLGLVAVVLMLVLLMGPGAAEEESTTAEISIKVDSGSSSAASDDKGKQKDQRRRRKLRKGEQEEGDGEGEEDGEEGIKTGDLTFIESEFSSLGWTKSQGHLVTKRPPRECAVKKISPQVTTPFFVLNKKTNWRRRIYTCIRHGKQQCSGSLIRDLEARRWKLKASKRPLEDRLLSTFVLTDSATLVKLAAKQPDAYAALYEANEGSTYLNALVGASGLDGSLMDQFQARAEFTKEFGCSYNALKVQPPQFRYDVYAECEKMERLFAKKLSDLWLLSEFDEHGVPGKPGLSSVSTALDGPGTFCADNAVYSTVKDSRKLGSLLPSEPLKLQGKLFDVRSFLLVGSTMPMVVFFQQGYVRQLERGKSILNPFQFDDEGGSNDIRLDAFQGHLAASKITGSHYVDTFLKQSMKQIALFVFHAARKKVQRRRGTFQLFALDYVIDKSFRVYLEKTTGSPDLDATDRYDPSRMVADMHDLVQELHEVPVAFQGMVKGDKYGSWELLFSELIETCNRIVYNPCHTFIDFNDKDLTKPNKKVGKVQATAKRLENEQKRIVKKTEEHKKETCRGQHVPYPSTKCNKLLESMEQETFNKEFKKHEESFNPNEFRLPKPGEVFPHETV